MLDRKFFKEISADVVMKYRKHIFDPAGGGSGANQVDGKPYPEYSKKGANVGWRSISSGDKRRSVFIDSYKNRKATGNMVVNGVPQNARFAGSKAPVLTGSLLRDYGFQQYLSNGFSFGFKSEGAKAERLNNTGRLLSTKKHPVPKSVDKFIMKEADRYIEKELGKIKGGTFNI